VTRGTTGRALASWYETNGRHDLPWRATRDRWLVLVSEVMLHQTQAPRVAQVYDEFVTRFPTPAITAAATPGAVISAWGRLGYPRRARWLWDAARRIDAEGWPRDLSELPGVGRYTAAAVAAQTADEDVVGIEVNIRRVCERVRGTRLSTAEAEAAAVSIAAPLRGRDRLLALMDLGATVCTARAPACDRCPVTRSCAARGPLVDETRHRQAAYQGSFRQRRGVVLAQLRAGPARTVELDGEALASLLDDGLAEITRGRAHLPRS
jgi:A/G-specific adenine glycosylase